VRTTQPVATGKGWELFAGRPAPPDRPPAAEVQISPDAAWRLFSRQLSPAQAAEQATLTGDLALARHVLTTVAIVA
jgi:hypothetical protein